jgi:hypothetical protein
VYFNLKKGGLKMFKSLDSVKKAGKYLSIALLSVAAIVILHELTNILFEVIFHKEILSGLLKISTTLLALLYAFVLLVDKKELILKGQKEQFETFKDSLKAELLKIKERWMFELPLLLLLLGGYHSIVETVIVYILIHSFQKINKA